MDERNVGALTVVDNGTSVEIVSERDYTRKVILKGRSSKETPVPFALESGIVFSRLYRDGRVNVLADDSVIRVGDVIRLVGSKTKLLEFERVIGRKSAIDLKTVPSGLTTERLYVTKRSVLGRSLRELDFEQLYGAIVTRVTRAEVEFAAGDDVRLQFGDLLFVVGSEGGVTKVAGLIGNKPAALDHPHVLPVFVGIFLGVILGSVPIVLPGTPAPVRLGLAGGPLIVALVLSQIGRVGPLIWYLTPGANLALREIGIVLFLACVGLKSGSRFLEVLISGSGVYWILAGAFLTLFPLVLVGFVARIIVKLDFATICGVLAGSMTDPPALAFAGTITDSDRPLVAYAAVYPFGNDSAGVSCPDSDLNPSCVMRLLRGRLSGLADRGRSEGARHGTRKSDACEIATQC